MKRKTVLKIGLGLFLAGTLVYLFQPLTSAEFKIEFSQELINGKTLYLRDKVVNDTTPVPNIILILADDLGRAEVSAYGQHRVNTPHIDAIAEKGVKFTSGYITSPICSPSRAGLITGRHQQRFGYELQPHDRYPKNLAEYSAFKYLIDTDNWVLADERVIYPRQEDILRQGLPPSEITIAEMLKKKNYSTGVIGKWHLGFSDFSFPMNRGFDEFFGFYEAFSLYAYEDDPQIVNYHHDWLFTDKYIWGPGRTGKSAIRRNEEEVVEKEYLTTKLAKEAVDFIERNQKQPFFLYVPFNAPHTPFQALKEDYDLFSHVEDENKRVYYAMIKSLDDAVGAITDKVESLGLFENTMIIFLSDNGGASYTLATDNHPLKGGKVTNFEGGIKIPFVMQWGNHIQAGSTCDLPVSSLDIFTTIAQVAGIPLPTDRPIDGKSLLATLEETTELQDSQRPLFWKSGYNHAIILDKWKLILNDKDNKTLLYNISLDPGEKVDMSLEHPELVESLKLKLSLWERDLAPAAWPRIMDWQYEVDGETYHFAM